MGIGHLKNLQIREDRMLQIVRDRFENNTVIKDYICHRYIELAEDQELGSYFKGDQWDGLETVYVGYKDKKYGLIGSARFVPFSKIQEELRPFIQESKDISQDTYVLMDCVFYIPDHTGFYDQERSVREAKFDDLLIKFHEEIVSFMETFMLQERLNQLLIYLEEDEFNWLKEFGKVQCKILKTFPGELDNPPMILSVKEACKSTLDKVG